MSDRAYVEKAAESGRMKLSLLKNDPRRYMARSILAGMYLAIVTFTFWALRHELAASPFGKVIGSAFFGVGLTIIVLTNTELFTSNNMYLAVSSAQGKTSWTGTLGLWTSCWLGNLVGSIIVAGMLYAAGALDKLPADHALYDGALHKAHQTAGVIFVKGILANWIVCLAARLSLRCKDDVSRILLLILVVFIFLYLGFEHSIANMGTFAFSILGHGQLSLGEAGFNLLFATLGNIVGGVFLVALPFNYVNPEEG